MVPLQSHPYSFCLLLGHGSGIPATLGHQQNRVVCKVLSPYTVNGREGCCAMGSDYGAVLVLYQRPGVDQIRQHLPCSEKEFQDEKQISTVAKK